MIALYPDRDGTCAFVGTGLGLLIGGLAAGASSAAAAKIQSGAAHRAGNQQAAAATDALNYQKEQDAIDRQQYLEERTRAYGQQDEDRALTREAYYGREGRLTPYRQLGADSAASLTALLRPNPNVDMHVPVVPPDTSAAALTTIRPRT